MMLCHFYDTLKGSVLRGKCAVTKMEVDAYENCELYFLLLKARATEVLSMTRGQSFAFLRTLEVPPLLSIA